jgi:uncharacterized membrane protein
MTRRGFLRRIDRARIEAAIADAEQRTTGEIRVSVAGLFWGGSRRFAARAFRRLGMTATRARNGVLILVLPWRRQLVIVGDSGIDGRVGATFWDAVVAQSTRALHEGRFDEGLMGAVAAVGRALAEHFPAPASGEANPNELPDRVS